MGFSSAECVGRKDGDPPGDLGRQPDEGEVDRFAADAPEDETAVEDVALAGVDEAGTVLEGDDRPVARAEDAERAERDRGRDDRRRRRRRRREARPDELREPAPERRRGRRSGRGVGVGGTWNEKTFRTTAPPTSPRLVPMASGGISPGRSVSSPGRAAAPGRAAVAAGPAPRRPAGRPVAVDEREEEDAQEARSDLREERALIGTRLPDGVAAAGRRAAVPARASRTVRMGRSEPGRK
jgi:hypothetical protein